jgi:hypothetical protein
MSLRSVREAHGKFGVFSALNLGSSMKYWVFYLASCPQDSWSRCNCTAKRASFNSTTDVVEVKADRAYMSGGTLMNNPHDDDLDARVEEIRSRPHWTWSDEDMDDLSSDAMLRMFEDREKRRLEGKLPPPPPAPAPKRSLVEMLLECGFVDARERKN